MQGGFFFYDEKEGYMNKKSGILVLLICIIIGIIAGVAAPIIFKKNNGAEVGVVTESNSNDTVGSDESFPVEIVDADAYYEQNATVVSVVDANASEDVQTEKELLDDLTNRGFSEISVFTDYDMDGTFHEEIEIGDKPTDKHPKYMAYYVTENSEVWTLIWINGKIMANPVSYNLQSTLPAQLVISETESINGYDNHTGKFYETIPNDNALIVKVVDSIDKDLLERLTIEEIDKL